jgi:hypothetical protein
VQKEIYTMKKLLLFLRRVALTALLAFAFTACGDGTDKTTLQIRNESSLEITQVVFQNTVFAQEDSDIVGTWTGKASNSANLILTLDIAEERVWTGLTSGAGFDAGRAGQGTWTRNAQSLTFTNSITSGQHIRSGTATLTGGKLIGRFNVGGFTYMFTLTSNNISDIRSTLRPGNSTTINVGEGSGYIYFRIGLIEYRTALLIVVERNKETEFIFTNNTLVVAIDNPGSAVTLSSL